MLCAVRYYTPSLWLHHCDFNSYSTANTLTTNTHTYIHNQYQKLLIVHKLNIITYRSSEIIQLILIFGRSQVVRKYCVQINFVSRGIVMTLDRYFKKKTVLPDPNRKYRIFPRQFTPCTVIASMNRERDREAEANYSGSYSHVTSTGT